MAVETTVISIAAIERLRSRETTVSGRLVFIGVEGCRYSGRDSRLSRRHCHGVVLRCELLRPRALVAVPGRGVRETRMDEAQARALELRLEEERRTYFGLHADRAGHGE